jgi:N-acetylglucosaminyldiphosphoundecaprenol N-acetyl-beta-D-mannosaminyltransferase
MAGRMTTVFGIDFCPRSEAELASLITSEKIPAGNGPRAVVTANLDHIVRLQDDPVFRQAYRRAWAVTADGMPVYLYAKLRGAPAPSRVPGSDLLKSVLPALAPERARVFLVASDVATAQRLRAYLIDRGFPSFAVDWVVPPFGFENNKEYCIQLARRVHERQTTHLLLGVGAPRSEIWVDRYRNELGDCYVLSVGAGLEFFAQTKRRAPSWMRRVGLEWLWRLGQDPRRLWRRYFIGAFGFVRAITNDLAGRA